MSVSPASAKHTPLKRHSYTIISIYVFQIMFSIVTFGTLIIPVEEDPTIWHFPFMVYLPNTLFILGLLFIVQKILKKKFGMIDYYSDNSKLDDFITLFDWKEDYNPGTLIIRRLSLFIAVVVTLLVWLLGIPDIEFLFSPMNFITLSFGLSMFSIWLTYGIREENSIALIYIITILLVDLTLHTIAAIIAGDELVLPLTLSYQIFSIVLILIRWISIKIK